MIAYTHGRSQLILPLYRYGLLLTCSFTAVAVILSFFSMVFLIEKSQLTLKLVEWQVLICRFNQVVLILIHASLSVCAAPRRNAANFLYLRAGLLIFLNFEGLFILIVKISLTDLPVNLMENLTTDGHLYKVLVLVPLSKPVFLIAMPQIFWLRMAINSKHGTSPMIMILLFHLLSANSNVFLYYILYYSI